jgi:hypothetical protein
MRFHPGHVAVPPVGNPLMQMRRGLRNRVWICDAHGVEPFRARPREEFGLDRGGIVQKSRSV